MAAKTGTLYGLLTEFDDAPTLVEAVAKCRDHGFTKWDVHTPFPIHGMDAAVMRLGFLGPAQFLEDAAGVIAETERGGTLIGLPGQAVQQDVS